MMTSEDGTVRALLSVVADLLRGDRHSRRTIARSTGRSLPTADRWIEAILAELPSARSTREGRTTWVHVPRPAPPRREAKKGTGCSACGGSGKVRVQVSHGDHDDVPCLVCSVPEGHEAGHCFCGAHHG